MISVGPLCHTSFGVSRASLAQHMSLDDLDRRDSSMRLKQPPQFRSDDAYRTQLREATKEDRTAS